MRNVVEKIVKKGDKYQVTSEDGKKNLGGPYDTEEEAKRRLQQVHYFKNKNKKVAEGVEGKKEPGYEYIIYDYTDEDGPNPIVAKRSTAVEAEFTAMRWMGNDYITHSRPHPKYKDRYLTFEKVPKGKFKVGDDFYGPFDADYNKLESVNEDKSEIEAYDSVYDPQRDNYYFVLPYKENKFKLKDIVTGHITFIDKGSPLWKRLRLKDKRAIREISNESLTESLDVDSLISQNLKPMQLFAKVYALDPHIRPDERDSQETLDKLFAYANNYFKEHPVQLSDVAHLEMLDEYDIDDDEIELGDSKTYWPHEFNVANGILEDDYGDSIEVTETNIPNVIYITSNFEDGFTTMENLKKYFSDENTFNYNLQEYVKDYLGESLGKSQITEKVSPEGYSPKKTGKAYKVFRVKNGKLYPPMVANAGGEDTPIGVWLDAEEGEFAGLSKTGRPQVKSTGSGNLAYRPGWHLGDVPRAPQFDRKNKETGELEFPKDFVWAECDYAMDVDYQPEADEQGHMRTKVDDQGNVSTYRSDKYQHSLAGLPKLPTDGYYKYRTNPRPDTVPWVITGQMKVNRLLSDDEVNEILKKKGIEPIHRQGGDKTLAELGLKESMTKGNNVLTEAVNEIWASDGMQSYYYTADISELKDELEDIGVDYSDMDEDDIRRYFLDDEFTMEQDYETFEYSILPEISKQCYADVLVLFGDYARWDGSRGAAKVLPKADKLSSFIYPEYEATTRIFQDETGVYYTQSTHDTPMGGTKIYLYSLKSEDDIQKLEDYLIKNSGWYDPEYDYPVDFLEDHSNYNDIKEYIDNGILTPIKL